MFARRENGERQHSAYACDDVPRGWNVVPLANVAEIRLSGVDKKTRSGEAKVLLCNYTDVYDREYITGTEDFMQATATPSEIARCSLRVGDVIITKDSETPDEIGVPAIVTGVVPNLVCGYHLALIRPQASKVDSLFLAKQLSHNRMVRYFARMANGVTRYGLGVGAISQAPVFLPPLDYQERAAFVFRVLDTAIREAEALIAKLRKIKAGLLHDLLTRGIDENGELRDPVSCPSAFIETDIGAIPESWTPTILGAVGDWHAGGTPRKGVAKYWNGSVPWLTPKDMKLFRIEKTTDYLTPLGATSGTCLVPAGAVFIVVRGMILAHTFPVCISSKPMAFNQDIRTVTPTGSTEMLFLAYWLVGNASDLLRLTTEATHGTKRLDMNELRRHPVVLPPQAEQIEIAHRLVAQDARIEIEIQNLEKLRALKSGLMHDLLTGKVRVPVRETDG